MSGGGREPAERRPLIAANWKMHFRAGEPAAYLSALLRPAPDLSDRDAVIFAPAPLLAETARGLAGTGIAVGAQTTHWEDRGAFTGEVSGPMAASAGATFCLVGHSERRLLFGEDHAAVARKLAAAFRNGLRPVLCVGERLEERRAGHELATVESQLRSALEGLGQPELARLAVAYEPVWAIGTGETATPEVAGAMHAAIREVLRGTAGDVAGSGTAGDVAGSGTAGDVAGSIPLLYGGSVTPGNVDALMKQPEIDGVLAGGASLDPASFRRILDFGRAPSPA